MEQVEVEALRIAYERAGTGPPLVLLHGYVGDGPTLWRRQLEGLCDDFTVVAWDAPGPVAHRIHQSRLAWPATPTAWPTTPTAWPASSSGSAWKDRTWPGCRSVARLPWSSTAGTPPSRRTLILASAYAGWAGSLPADVAEQRLQQALVLADLSPEEFVGTLLPTMFCQTTPQKAVDAFGTSMLRFHPAGFRAMARASAEDLRGVLPHITVPTLLVYGDRDVRAPLTVAQDLHAAISGSTLVVLPDAGHVCNIDAPEAFNSAVRNLLHDTRS
jgi:pimeloyl-ACP methyl ester carboxylesterase